MEGLLFGILNLLIGLLAGLLYDHINKNNLYGKKHFFSENQKGRLFYASIVFIIMGIYILYDYFKSI